MADEQSAPPISLKRRRAITAGLLLGMRLGALEATVVGTAMPTVVATLGGSRITAGCSRPTADVHSLGADLGTSLRPLRPAADVPDGSCLPGRLARFGRAEVDAAADLSRTLQGLGAGAIIPLSMTIVGELYTLAERPRTQALFSGVWGLARSPDRSSAATSLTPSPGAGCSTSTCRSACCALASSRPRTPRRRRAVQVDWLGAALLFSASARCCSPSAATAGGAWLVAGHGSCSARSSPSSAGGRADPAPRSAPRPAHRPDARRGIPGRLSLFGAIAFIPLFVQAVHGGHGHAGGAGADAAVPRLGHHVDCRRQATVKLGYRPVAIGGSGLMTLGFVGLALLTPDRHASLLWRCLVIGAGMGLSMLSLLLAVQHGVDRSQLGIATALNQFSRSVGAAIGMAAMGALLARGWPASPFRGRTGRNGRDAAPPPRVQFAAALHRVFIAGAWWRAGWSPRSSCRRRLLPRRSRAARANRCSRPR